MSIFTNPASRSREEAAAYTAAVLDLLGPDDPMDVLERTERALHPFVDGRSAETLARPEAPGKWSVRHVIQHLADSELVWGWRLRIVLAQDRPVLTGYDQDLWAERLRYDEADAAQALHDFATIRDANLRLLRRLSAEDMERAGVHSERGAESIGHMIRLYAGHDLLHLRQIERILGVVT